MTNGFLVYSVNTQKKLMAGARKKLQCSGCLLNLTQTIRVKHRAPKLFRFYCSTAQRLQGMIQKRWLSLSTSNNLKRSLMQSKTQRSLWLSSNGRRFTILISAQSAIKRKNSGLSTREINLILKKSKLLALNILELVAHEARTFFINSDYRRYLFCLFSPISNAFTTWISKHKCYLTLRENGGCRKSNSSRSNSPTKSYPNNSHDGCCLK